MKITKRQLRRIIKEEKRKLLREAPRDRINTEAGLMADLDSIATSIEEIAAGMYGLEDPNGASQGAAAALSAGDEMAGELEMQVERLNSLHAAMVRHFESMDPEEIER